MKGTTQKKEPVSYEWIGNIPTDWKIEKLKRILISPLMYGTNEAAELEDKDLPRYIRITDFNGDGILREDTFKSLPFYKAEGYYLKEGDVLFARSGATVGKSFIFNNYKGRACFAGYLIKASPNLHKLLPAFLYYYTQSSAYDIWCSSIFTQATIQNISATKYAYLPIPLPTITIQQRIASYLDKTCAAIDKAIEAKQKQLEILDALRKSIIHKAVTRGLDDSVELKDSGVEWLGRIPKHWNCEHLKRVCSRIQTGSTPPTANTEYYVDGTIPWYAPGCYDGDIYLQEPAKEINEIAYFNNKLRLYPAHSIFIVGIGATIGKVAMTRVEASCNQQITALVCNSDVYAKYLTYHLKIFESIIPRIAQFTTLPIMDQNKIGYLQIAVPPIKEQEQIAEFLDDKIAMNDRLENNLVKQISILRQYRKSLIHECVTGKRRITDDDVQDQL